MPNFNALFAWLRFHGFCKIVNMGQFLSPACGQSFDVLFSRKLPNADGSPSKTHVINEYLMALFHFYVECSSDASAPYKRSKKHCFKEHLKLYKTWEKKSVDWRGELRGLLKL